LKPRGYKLRRRLRRKLPGESFYFFGCSFSGGLFFFVSIAQIPYGLRHAV
jgi:hypothetical protein